MCETGLSLAPTLVTAWGMGETGLAPTLFTATSARTTLLGVRKLELWVNGYKATALKLI